MQVFATHDGHAIHEATLTSQDGVKVSVLSLGAMVRDWRVPRRDGSLPSVTVGFDTYGAYLDNPRAFGITVGRIANRVRNGQFSLDGTTYQLDINNPPDHIHGGKKGIGKQIWAMESDGRMARLTLSSPEGEMGYPGKVDFTIDITLEGHSLTFDMTGVPDRPTPIALAQHSYYYLGGPVSDHIFSVAAKSITELGPRKIPTGRIVPMAGTPFDFSAPRAIEDTEIDINFCLDEGVPGSATPAGVLKGADFELILHTDRPGLQAYNGYDFPLIATPGHDGRQYGPFPAVALEAQDFPDAVNNANFPSVICTPEKPYRQTTTVTIKPI